MTWRELSHSQLSPLTCSVFGWKETKLRRFLPQSVTRRFGWMVPLEEMDVPHSCVLPALSIRLDENATAMTAGPARMVPDCSDEPPVLSWVNIGQQDDDDKSPCSCNCGGLSVLVIPIPPFSNVKKRKTWYKYIKNKDQRELLYLYEWQGSHFALSERDKSCSCRRALFPAVSFLSLG